jgi:hypothetical protein
MSSKQPDSSIVQVDNEEDYKKYLETVFERNGWSVDREVYPDKSKKQVDIIAEHPDYGKYGIEAKYTNYGGSTPAHAHHQIVKKYREKTFDGDKILKWVYAPFYTLEQMRRNRIISQTRRDTSGSTSCSCRSSTPTALAIWINQT